MTIEGNASNLIDDPGDLEVSRSGPSATGILGGGRLTRVRRIGQPDIYIQLYLLPGASDQWVYYQYDPTDGGGESPANGIPDEIEGTFGNSVPTVYALSEDRFNDINGRLAHKVGDASAITGLPGTFNSLWTQTVQQSLVAAGAGDPGIQGRLIADPGYAALVARSALSSEPLSQAQFTAEFRNLPIYQEIYPGINFFLNRGDANPEQSYAAYRTRMTPLLRSLGIAPDPDGSYRSSLSTYLDAGVSDAELEKFAPVLRQIQQNPGLKEQMDAWAQHELGRNLDFNEFIDVLQGTSDPELERVIEGATLAFQAEQAGINISVTELRKIAASTDLTEREALAAFTEADRQILATFHSATDRERVKETYGIEAGDLLDAAVGITPRSGLSRAKVLNIQQKLAQERGLLNIPSGGFFLGFSSLGQPQRQGLTALSAVGG